MTLCAKTPQYGRALLLLSCLAIPIHTINAAAKDESACIQNTKWGTIQSFSDKAKLHRKSIQIKVWPTNNRLSLPTPFPNIVRAWFKNDTAKSQIPILFNRDASEITLQLPKKSDAAGNTIQLITTEKTKQHPDGVLVLSALDSKVNGTKAKLETHPGNHRIGFWSNAKDTVNWSFSAKPGEYDVELVYSTASKDGTEVRITFDKTSVDARLESTGTWYMYTAIPVGRIKLNGTRQHTASVACTKKVGGAVMNLKAVVLHPYAAKTDKALLGKTDRSIDPRK